MRSLAFLYRSGTHPISGWRISRARNSLNSYARNNGEVIDYFPEAPSDVVYWGLAGDIVRRIAPHTEADPVALLIQILAVFGNVIGRRAYTIADGALHALNIFAVACGGIE